MCIFVLKLRKMCFLVFDFLEKSGVWCVFWWVLGSQIFEDFRWLMARRLVGKLRKHSSVRGVSTHHKLLSPTAGLSVYNIVVFISNCVHYCMHEGGTQYWGLKARPILSRYWGVYTQYPPQYQVCIYLRTIRV